MTKPWHPRVIRGGRRPKLPAEWRVSRRRRLPRFGWKEISLMAMIGLLGGLALAGASTIGAGAAGAPVAAIAGDSENPAFVRVIDGDTFDYRGERIRVADIDTPEVEGRCPAETALAERATARMRALLAAGPFELHPLASGRDEDRYGRKLRIVTRGGRSLGDQLVAEGLARTWSGRREPWC
jgi:micrococcal nuclease